MPRAPRPEKPARSPKAARSPETARFPETARSPEAPGPAKRAAGGPRRRRDATLARAAILDAAERRLVEAGPAGIRLQEVAADVGVSHPTVLHHFGSREALVNAVIARTFAALHAELVEAIQGSSGDEAQLAAMLDAVFRTLSTSGHGRVLMWMALEGHRAGGAEVRLSAVVDAACALRMRKRGGEGRTSPPGPAGAGTSPPRGSDGEGAKGPSSLREDTAHLVVLAALALSSFTVLGPTLLEEAGLAHDEAAGGRFRAWLARLLTGHLESNGGAAPCEPAASR